MRYWDYDRYKSVINAFDNNNTFYLSSLRDEDRNYWRDAADYAISFGQMFETSITDEGGFLSRAMKDAIAKYSSQTASQDIDANMVTPTVSFDDLYGGHGNDCC